MPDGMTATATSPGNVVIAEIEKNSREIIVVAMSEFKRISFVDIRVNYKTETGDFAPTKKGVAVRPEKLPELIAALQTALGKCGTASG